MVHPWEEFYRLKQFLHNRFIDRLYLNFSKKIFSKDFKNIDDHGQIHSNSIECFTSVKNYHTYPFYNCKINLNKRINWRYDYKNKIESPLERHSKINKNDFETVGELKYAFEPSRFNFLPFYTIQFIKESNKKSYSPITHLKDWFEENPYLNSFNWKDGIEVGIRSINLCYSYLLLRDNDFLSNKEQTFTKNLLYLHFHFLKNHQSKYSSSNNHFISELIGLFVITSCFKFKGSEKWNRYSFKKLIDEFPNQFYKDGFSTEQTTCYHKDVLSQYGIFISFVKKRSTLHLPDDFLLRVHNAYEALEAFKITKNEFFQVGDNDNSIIVNDYCDHSTSEYESVINDGRIIFSKDLISTPDRRNYLLWNNEEMQVLKVVNDCYRSKKKIFTESGYALLNDNNFNVLFDFGILGFRFAAAHGHSDILSVQLYVNGIPFLCDTGTYQYHKKYIGWRNYFRGISAHNTVSINGMHHANPLSNMIWDSNPSGQLIDYKDSDHMQMAEGSYEFSNDQKHIRKTELRTGELVITDTIMAGMDDHYEIFFHLHPGCSVEMEHENEFRISHGDTGIQMVVSGNIRSEIISGDENIPLGWYSGKYDVLEPTNVIRLNGIIGKSGKAITETKIKLI
jgi:hypothetical protein